MASCRQTPRGFTLIELVVVMSLLATILAFAAPTLGRFMSGRNIVEEGRRLVAATRYARSEAIARGEKMELWIKTETGEYGIRPQSATLQEEEKPVQFKVADKLGLEIDNPTLNENGEVVILFWPDGQLDEAAPQQVTLTEEGEPRKALTLTENRMTYMLEDATVETRSAARTRAGGTAANARL